VGLKRVRLTNIAPETSEYAIKLALEKYGEVRGIKVETWARAFRFSVDSGVRIAMMPLVKHIPSHLLIAGQRSLVYYDGQPMTCCGCNDVGHVYMECPKRNRMVRLVEGERVKSWAVVVINNVR
jgi:hypothetical protein